MISLWWNNISKTSNITMLRKMVITKIKLLKGNKKAPV